MNIYVDTNILFTDPFFKSNFFELLLRLAKEEKVKIFIPHICLKELKAKLSERIKNIELDITNKFGELNRLTNSKEELKINSIVQGFEEKIKNFYNEAVKDKVFTILKNKDEHYLECLDKAIDSFMPFFDGKKEEFRDSLIWCCIREQAIADHEKSNYFVTGNYHDFWNADRTDLHQNLKKENEKILIVDSFKKIFENESNLLNYKRNIDFRNWFEKQKINEDIIKHSLKIYLWNHIVSDIDNSIKLYPINRLRPNYDIGYILPKLIKESVVVDKIIKVTIVDSFAEIEIEITIPFEGKLFYPNYEKGDLSNYEDLFFVANFNLNVGYDSDLLFKPINISIVNISIT